MVRCFLINTPLDPSRLPIRRIHRPTLLETRSQRGMGMNSVRIRGREPLRSASRLRGCIPIPLSWGPSHKVVAGPSCGPLCFQDPSNPAPGSFLGRHIVGIGPRQASIALGLPCLTAAFPDGRVGRICRRRSWHDMAQRSRNGPGKLTGIPPCWRPACTGINNID